MGPHSHGRVRPGMAGLFEWEDSMASRLADSTIEKLRLQLLQRREAAEHAANTFHDEATEAIETTDISDVLDEDDPDSSNAESSLLLAVNADHHLQDIDLAFERLAAGTYGTCEDCGRPIPVERLRAIPETSVCIDCSKARIPH